MGVLSQTLDAARKALDMSREARMARAREQGFDTERVWYHGTRADIDAFDAGLAGTNTGSSDPGIWFSRDPRDAPNWFSGASNGALDEAGIDMGLPDARGGNIVPAYLPDGMYKLDDWGVAEEMGWESNSDVIDWAQGEGFFGVEFPYGSFSDPGPTAVVFDPSNIRSVNAAFDPAQRNSSSLLAGVGGAAVGAGLLAAPQESTAGAAQANTVGSVTNVPPMYAPSAAQRERAIRAEQERLLREHARASQGDTIEAPRYPWLAAAADWAGSQQLPGVPLYDQPLAGTAETLNRLAYGDYRPGGHGLGTLAMDSLMTGLELVDPGTWAAVAAPEPRRMSPAEAAAERFSTARRGKRSAYKASVRKDP